MVNRFKNWFERFFEEPFFQAEVAKAEIMLEKKNGSNFMVELAGSLSYNYETIKYWSK
ncbi:MAG: hypothetical protein ACOY30_02630 [Bacillota bacterium]